ncbi:hypothetical protein CPT12_28395, partial [Klebsiella pneumoniae]
MVLATGVQPDSRLAAQSGVLCQRGIWRTGAYSAPPRVVLATGVQPDSRLAAQSGVLCQRGI